MATPEIPSIQPLNVRAGQPVPEAGTALQINPPVQNLDGADSVPEGMEQQAIDSLAAYIHGMWQMFKNHDETTLNKQQCLRSLRTYRGEYDSSQLHEIKAFGGSTVYSHITSTKCRGATALLRDIFLGQEQTWGLAATPDPKLPGDAIGDIREMVDSEVQTMTAAGQQVDPQMVDDRVKELMDAAMRANEKNATGEAKKAEKKLQDILVEGQFYDALVDFITDLPIFPHAVIKGPVVKQVMDNKWENGQLVHKYIPRMFWYRVSPFDVYFTPGASSIDESASIEYIKVSRAELNSLIGLPGYDEDAIRAVLTDYSGGYVEAQADDSERAWREGREDPWFNQSGLIDSLEWQGSVQGKLLLDYGFTPEQVPDGELDYFVTAWVIGRHTIKVQISMDALQRPNYYSTSFEKIPGSIRGFGLPDILEDIQRLANGCLRALSNNMAMSSGPQVAIDEERLSPSTDANTIYPWKRWRFLSDPHSNTTIPAVAFFQPQSNATELLSVYKSMTDIADETSSIPRYLTGNTSVGGAGRTASGLSMLMNSAAKMMQVVAANIDRDVMRPVLERLYDMVMLMDKTGMLRGDEDIQVRGVEIARQRELERSRRMEFLSIITNPVDAQIIGTNGRAEILREIATDLGMPGNKIVPSDKELEIIKQQQAQQQEQEAAMEGMGSAPKPSGSTTSTQMGNQMRKQT